MPSKQILNRTRPHGDSEVFPCNFADFADFEDFNWPNYIFLSLDPSMTAYSGDAGTQIVCESSVSSFGCH